MSGPALKHIDSHSSIHEAALDEARELTDFLSKLLANGKYEDGLKTAQIALEHWESRTLQHAQAEEDGLYKELLQEKPEVKDQLITLTRDHNLMRRLAGDIKEMLLKEKVNEEVLQKFYALILIDDIHNQEEEKVLPHH